MALLPYTGDPFYKAVGEAIRKAREERGLSQNALATAVGLKRTSITNIEKGRQKFLIHTAYEIAAVLQVSLAELLPAASASTQLDTPHELPAELSEKERAFVEAGIGLKKR